MRETFFALLIFLGIWALSDPSLVGNYLADVLLAYDAHLMGR